MSADSNRAATGSVDALERIADAAEVGDAIEAYPRAPGSHKAQLAQLIRKRNAELQCGHKLDALDGPEVHAGA